MKTEWLYGIHPVQEALNAGRRRIHDVHFARSKPTGRLKDIAEMAAFGKIPVRTTAAERLTADCGADTHQNVAARVSGFPFSEMDEILETPSPFLLVLDSITDIHNMGALIRTALCAGVDGVILPKDRNAQLTPAVSKASAGALEHIRALQVTNIANTLRALKDKGLWRFGLDIGGSTSLFGTDMTGPIAVVVGNEEKGIRPLVRKECDFRVVIPQHGNFNSLNASVAGAVMMYECLRQRQGK